MVQTMERKKRLFSPAETHNLAEEARQIEEDTAGTEFDFFYEGMAKSRPDLAEEIVKALQAKGGRVVPFARLKRANLNNPSDEDALPDFSTDTYQPKPYAHGETQQPAGQHILVTEIEIFVKSTLLVNTLDVLMEQHGVRVHYPDGRPPLEFPLADVLNTRRWTPAAGTAASNDAIVAGTQSQLLGTTKVIRLLERDAWGIKPGDSTHKLEFFRYPEYDSVPALTGETADLFFYIIYRGAQHRTGRSKS